MIYYNAFGQFVSEKSIEGFANDETPNIMEKIQEFKKNLESGKISKEQVTSQMNEFRSMIKDGKITDEQKKALEDVIQNTVRQMDGINLVGNLELGGIIKARGFHLHDGTAVKEVIKTKDKLAVPIDGQGNINLKPTLEKGDVNIGSQKGNINMSSNIVNLKSVVDIEAIKRTGKEPSVAPALYVTATSNAGGYNKNAIAEFRHTNQTQGIGIGHNTIYGACTNANQDVNIKAKGTGVVRNEGKTVLGRSSTDPGELWINNPKNGNNSGGWPTHFNYNKSGLNYIRGKTEMRGEVNLVDNTKGINISNAKNNDNSTGWGTHFNYQGKALNYIRGKTEMRGETNFVDKAKGINISNPKNGNNAEGWGTHFNYQGKGLNYIRGTTEIRAPDVNVITNKGIKVKGHGKESSFGSLNSGWCHLITNAPQFYMNKSLQVHGGISSYSNKPLNAHKGVNAPHLSRIGGDWLRINPEGNSAGRTAVYGGFSINDVRGGKAGLGVGYWGYPGRGNIRATGNIQANNGLRVTGGRTWIQDAEKKGRLRVGAAWGIPGLYSEDNQDIVIGCNSNRQVHLGRPNLVRIDKSGNLHLPGNANIYIGGKKVVKNGDPITIRSNRNGYRMQHSNWNQAARFSNRNRGGWERMYIETF